MATSSEDKFPPQSQQQQQPGQEHVMRPLPTPLAPNYKPSAKLLGKVALVTGGDSGIGRSVCLHFALEGATVAFTYIKGVEDKDKDGTLVMLLEAKTVGAKDPLAIAADIGFDDNCRKLVDLVVNEYGRIDILVNNAAEQHLTRSVEEITESRLERVFRTNIFSHFFLARTSVNAYNGGSEVLDYTATKGAIVAFTRVLALQFVNKGIRVNAVAPGPVWTPLQPASMPGRAAQPHEIAPCYVFLACNQCSSYFTGQVLHPNGNALPLLTSLLNSTLCSCLGVVFLSCRRNDSQRLIVASSSPYKSVMIVIAGK
ncbi:Glucose and ribitol dehydrogenase [Linum perenne]